MPIERREIRLTGGELLRAVDGYGHATPGLLPPGALRRADVVPSAGAVPIVTATVRMPPEPIVEDVEIELSEASVIEMLICFCREENIPIPRSGLKSVHVVDGLLTLVIDNGHTTPAAHSRSLIRVE